MATNLPLVFSCRGGTAATRLAEEAGEALARLGAAETTGDAARALAAARQGRRVVALDGCASACRARLLEAHGVRARPALNLADLGAAAGPAAGDAFLLAREAAARLRQRQPARSQARPRMRRSAQPAAALRLPRPHDVNDYLLAIDALASASVACGAVVAETPTLAAHVSQLLGVSRPSAGEALARLQARGLVRRGAHKQIVLSPRGRLAADRIIRRHRLLERFAVDYFGYAPHESFERARALEHAFDDDAIERLRDKLGRPERCPHGWPVDPLAARAENEELATLLAAPVGKRVTITRIAERDDAAVRRLIEAGATPGVEVVVERRSERTGITLRVDSALRTIDDDAAATAFVYSTLWEESR